QSNFESDKEDHRRHLSLFPPCLCLCLSFYTTPPFPRLSLSLSVSISPSHTHTQTHTPTHTHPITEGQQNKGGFYLQKIKDGKTELICFFIIIIISEGGDGGLPAPPLL